MRIGDLEGVSGITYTGLLETGCDAALRVGMHARAGSAGGVLSHTVSSSQWQNSGSTASQPGRRRSTPRPVAPGAAGRARDRRRRDLRRGRRARSGPSWSPWLWRGESRCRVTRSALVRTIGAGTHGRRSQLCSIKRHIHRGSGCVVGVRPDGGSMPSRTQMWRRTPKPTQVAATADWVSHLSESTGDHIRLLAKRRQAALREVATCRREGHLVPGSVSQELAENASELRGAMERYRKVRAPHVPDGSAAASASAPRSSY